MRELLLILLLIFPFRLWAADLYVAASSYLSEPYTFYNHGELQGGVVKDIFDQLGAKLGVNVRYVDIPRKRIELGLESGEIHIAPVAHPQWLVKPAHVEWTEALYGMRELIILRASRKAIFRSLADLKGFRIGTILGYYYPVLDAYFQSGALVRSDVLKADQNVDMLLSDRIDGYVAHDIAYRYFQKVDARAKGLAEVEMDLTDRPIQWAVSRKSPVSLDALNAFIRDFKRDGRLEQVLRKYRLEPLVH